VYPLWNLYLLARVPPGLIQDQQDAPSLLLRQTHLFCELRERQQGEDLHVEGGKDQPVNLSWLEGRTKP
jgi:hypothetical protein